jgi:hypothetical protein
VAAVEAAEAAEAAAVKAAAAKAAEAAAERVARSKHLSFESKHKVDRPLDRLFLFAPKTNLTTF